MIRHKVACWTSLGTKITCCSRKCNHLAKTEKSAAIALDSKVCSRRKRFECWRAQGRFDTVEENRYTLPQLREIKHAIRSPQRMPLSANPITTKRIAIPIRRVIVQMAVQTFSLSETGSPLDSGRLCRRPQPGHTVPYRSAHATSATGRRLSGPNLSRGYPIGINA